MSAGCTPDIRPKTQEVLTSLSVPNDSKKGSQTLLKDNTDQLIPEVRLKIFCFTPKETPPILRWRAFYRSGY